MAANVTLGGSA